MLIDYKLKEQESNVNEKVIKYIHMYMYTLNIYKYYITILKLSDTLFSTRRQDFQHGYDGCFE